MKISPVFAVLLLVACAETGRTPLVGAGARDGGLLCTDEDGDGFGEGCARGGDCNDTDPLAHQGCLSCVNPAEGCACDNSNKPISCYLEPSPSDDGGVMCHEGTRYCRDGGWSACESIFSYPKPEVAQPQAVVNKDAGTEKCSDCRPNCFIVRDNLGPIDGGLGDAAVQTQITDGGGLALGTYTVDSGPVDASTYDAASCMLNSAPDKDCDGILDIYDPYPLMKPFATANPTIFLDIAAGATGTGVVNLAFYLNSADVYFLLDQTGSMSEERANLVAGLTTGDYVNNAAYKCSDFDFDGVPNNELKSKGVIGAVRCYIRDANFGVGFFREIPFDARSGGFPWLPWQYAEDDDIAFRNFQDITSDVAKVTIGVGKLSTRANLDWDEAAMPGLYTLVTGNGMYFGTNKTSIPTRTSCPVNTWGYPCFRKDAIPIVVLFTDAPTHNGPTTNTSPYDASDLNITRNTSSSALEAAGNETYLTATNAGDVTNSYVTYAGDTSNMLSDTTTSAFTCASAAGAPDAFYKFSLTSTKNVTISTEGSEFDTTVALWGNIPAAATSVAAASNNDTFSNAYNFGDITSKYVVTSGSSTGLASDYLAGDLGCSSYSGSPDTAFKFTLTQATKVALDTSGSTIGTSLSLFSGTPTTPTYTTASNSNDTLANALSIGPINTLMKAYSGTTNIGTITNNYTGAQIGCGTADNSPDAVYSFAVGTPTRVRVTTEDSALDTVLALVDGSGNTLTTSTAYSNNDSESSSNGNINLGALDGKSLRVTGSTSSLDSDYDNALVGCDATSRDAVFKFTLAQEHDVQIDSITPTTAMDTVIGLFRGSIISSDTAYAGQTSYENLASAGYPGAIDAKHYKVTGTTNGMVANYLGAQTGTCNTAAADSSPDAVYRLHLNAQTDIRLDTLGSAFDTVLSLHSALPDQTSTTITTGDTVASPYAIAGISNRNAVFSNSGAGTTSFAADVAVNSGSSTCAAHAAAPDAVLSFSVATLGSYQIDTIGSGFDTVLGVFPQASITTLPTATNSAGSGDASGGAVDAGALTAASWKSYTGTVSSSFVANKTDFTGCGASGSNGRDVFYKFNVTTTQTITIDTIGSAYDTVLGVFKSDLTQVPNTIASSYCNDNGANPGDSITGTFTTGTYYVVVKGKTSGSSGYGAYKISFRGSAAGLVPAGSCDDQSGGSNTSKLTLTLSPGNYYAVVKGKTATDKGTYKLAVKHIDWVTAGGTVVACNDNSDTTTTTSRIDVTNLAAGDYYVVIKGKNNASSGHGSYVLNMQDTGTLPNGWVACNDNANTSTTASSIRQTLPAGTYWVVVKGRTGGSPTRGAYGLNILDKDATASASVIACDYNSGSGGTSAIETDLAAGTYRVIVKGKASSDKGAYKLQVRDVTTLPTGSNRLNCDYQSGTGNKSYLEQQLNAGTYTVLLKGDAASGGAYKLSVRDATNVNATETPLYCNNDASGSTETSKISNKSLTAGTYYVGVKGNTLASSGRYQISFGAGSTASSKYVPPTWAETLAALTAKKVRVIPILSCKDDLDHGNLQGDCGRARTQFTALANATGALGSSLQPLIYDIDHLGTGLSDTVVKGIASLAQYLEMNVSAQVAFDPDPNPGFTLVIKAISKPGDGCNGVIGAEFQKCAPGATPRFEISFTNPLSAPVPRNSPAKDPNGGYNFKAQLIANNQFVVDTVPIYIIPENVTSAPPPPKVYASGTYNQQLAANGCAGKTDLPDWSDLTWSSTIPNGTNVAFGVCSGMNASAAASCTPTPICKISGGAACSAMSPCPTGSFCSTAGNCNTITGNACTTNANCPSSATCRSNLCTFDGQPIDVGEILGAQNGAPNLRVQITLNANTTSNVGPSVSDWQINYLCKSSL